MSGRAATLSAVAVALAACRAPARTDLAAPASAPPVVAPPASAALPEVASAKFEKPPTSSPVSSETGLAPILAKAGPSQSAAAEAEPPAKTPTKPVALRSYAVAAIGDSLTDFRSHGGGYLLHLRQRCPESRFDSYGKGGDMVNQMRRRMGRDLFNRPPVAYTHLIVFGGVNDLYSDITATRTVAKITSDLSLIYAAGHEHGMKVIALTVSPWGGFSRYYTEARGETTRELNRWIVAQRGSAVDYVVDTYSLLSCGDPEKLCDRYFEPFRDGLHFGPTAHKKVADAIYDAVFSDCR